jgi:TonB family protein
MRSAVAAVVLLSCLACAPGRPEDPLAEEPELTREQAACLARPEVVEHLEAVKERILAAWELPPGLRRPSEITLLIRIDGGGEIVSAAVLDAGSSALEESALAAVEAARPYPPLPAEAECLRGGHLRASFRNQSR